MIFLSFLCNVVRSYTVVFMTWLDYIQVKTRSRALYVVQSDFYYYALMMKCLLMIHNDCYFQNRP